MTVTLISYDELSRLRLKDFLGESAETIVDESGMMIAIGLGGCESFGPHGKTLFGWPQGETYRTAEVAVDLSPDSSLSKDVAARLIQAIGLPLRAGMSADELLNLFGSADRDSGPDESRFLRFTCGDKEPYYLGCHIEGEQGLVHFFLARKDYCDRDTSKRIDAGARCD